MHKIQVFSRHPSHKILRKRLPKLPVRAVVRLGSLTETKFKRIEINPVNAIKISSNKMLMKEAFDSAECPTPRWVTADSLKDLLNRIDSEDIQFPIVAKHILGSRGTGNYLLKDKDQLKYWASNRNFQKYIFEGYVNYLLEYRLHITQDGCFYACRKALIRSTEKSERWRRHKDNSVWLLETNPDFHKPNSWNDIVKSCINALKEIGADLLSFDVRVQGRLDKEGNERDYQDFILLECNSASGLASPSGAEISVCASKYLDMIPKLIMEKVK